MDKPSMLLIDAETYSECDLKAKGDRLYAQDPSTEQLLWSIRALDWDDSLVMSGDLWDLLNRLKEDKRIKWSTRTPLTLVHWTSFDRNLMRYAKNDDHSWRMGDDNPVWLGPNNTEWIDLAEISRINGGPTTLNFAARFWAGAKEDDGKIKGKPLINLFSKPQKNGKRVTEADEPVRWEEFRA